MPDHCLASFTGAGAQPGKLMGIVQQEQTGIIQVEAFLDQVYAQPQKLFQIQCAAGSLGDLGCSMCLQGALFCLPFGFSFAAS